MVFDANPSVLEYAQPPVLDIDTLVQQVRCLRRAMTLEDSLTLRYRRRNALKKFKTSAAPCSY